MASELPESLRGLLLERAYPHRTQSIKVIGTHISWVILTGEFAYKIKRPVRYAFVDQRTPEQRAFLCHEELRLNRRFAPDLYLEVCPITLADGEARIGGPGQAVEHAVRMRQFPQSEQLNCLIRESRIASAELDAFGRALALLHDRLPRPAAAQQWGTPTAIRRIITDNLEECAQAAQAWATAAEWTGVHAALLTRLETSMAVLAQRFAAGRIRECHGDLHTGNLVRTPHGLIPFDCLEFNPALRWIDVADEVAFLVADLQASGAELHAHAFLHGYLEQSGDFDACRVLDLFRAHRSLVRAKVATLSPDGTGDFLRYLSRARAALEPKRPRLVLMSGMSGSGKTWLAQRLAPLLGAVHMRSDIERRRLAGIDMRSSSHSALDGGAYAPLMNEAVYERLAVCAQAIMEGGFTAIVDATFQRRMDRSRLCEVAARLGARTWLIHCHAPDSILEERINQRQRRHEDPSEADLSVLRAQSARFEPIGSDEPLTLVDASTDQAGILERVALALGLTP